MANQGGKHNDCYLGFQGMKTAMRSDSAHLVCLTVLGTSAGKIGTTPDRPDRPNHLSEMKLSQRAQGVTLRISPISAGKHHAEDDASYCTSNEQGEGVELRKIINSPIGTALLVVLVAFIVIFTISSAWEFISTTIFPNTTLGVYNRGFWENVLVELHGMLIELAVVGVLLLWLDGRREHAKSILQSKEELTDYADLDFPEAHLRKMGALKRLSVAGNTNFIVRDLHLIGRELKGLKLKGSSVIGMRLTGGKITSTTFDSVDMRSSNFVDCTIRNTSFMSVRMYKCNFQGATLAGVKFEDVDINQAEFINCTMPNTIFKKVSLAGVRFDGADLSRCSFLGARDIDVAQLAKAKKLDYISISKDLLTGLIVLRPNIKFQRDTRRP